MNTKSICVFVVLFIALASAVSVFPSGLTKSSGSFSSQNINALQSNVMTGDSHDPWETYIEFDGEYAGRFVGTFTFNVGASGINPASVSSAAINVNYMGPKSSQTWIWSVINPSNGNAVVIGNNQNIPSSWKWTMLGFNIPAPFSSYVSSSGILSIRYESATQQDSSMIDFFELSITGNSNTPSPTTTTTTTTTTGSSTGSSTPAPSAGSRLCGPNKIWAPTSRTSFHIQYTGTMNYNRNVQAYNIDLFSKADGLNGPVVSNLHSRGIAVICYFSSQYEDWRPDAAEFTEDILGNPLDDWEGERWADFRTPKLRNIMKNRLDLAVTKGCDAVDIDNVDVWDNDDTGLSVTAQDQLDFLIFMSTEAHARKLAVGLKNDLAQIPALVSYFDFAVNEQCNEYDECDDYDPFFAANKAVFGIEYNHGILDSPLYSSSTCPSISNSQIYTTFKGDSTGSLSGAYTDCCSFSGGNCAYKAPYLHF